MVNKLTLPATPNEVQNKINEIIDSGGGGGGGTTYTAGDGIDITNNVISVDGVQTSQIDVYTKTEIDNMIGDIETLLHNLNSGS